jgi:hypothetical protein
VESPLIVPMHLACKTPLVPRVAVAPKLGFPGHRGKSLKLLNARDRGVENIPHHCPNSPGTVGCCHTAAEAREPLNRPNAAAFDRFVFKIEGLDCAEEVAILKREMAPLVGGTHKLGFDILNAKMTVAADASACSARDICAAVARTGMRAEEWKRKRLSSEPADDRRRRLQAALAATSGLFILCGIAAQFLSSIWQQPNARSCDGRLSPLFLAPAISPSKPGTLSAACSRT